MTLMKRMGTWCSGLVLPVLFLVICSSMKQPAAIEVNPVGEYEFSSVDDGQQFMADVKIEGEPGNYTGSVKRRDLDMVIRFTDVAVSANKMIIVADVRTNVFVLRFSFTGDTFTGSWAMGNEGNELKGKRNR